jgi:hypothetical protein
MRTGLILGLIVFVLVLPGCSGESSRTTGASLTEHPAPPPLTKHPAPKGKHPPVFYGHPEPPVGH